MTSTLTANQKEFTPVSLSRQVKSQLVFVRDSLELISGLYCHDNLSTVTWDTVKTKHFRESVYSQIGRLNRCVSRQTDRQTDASSVFSLTLTPAVPLVVCPLWCFSLRCTAGVTRPMRFHGNYRTTSDHGLWKPLTCWPQARFAHSDVLFMKFSETWSGTVFYSEI